MGASSITVYYVDGRVVYFPETSFSDQFGASVCDDYNLRFDVNILEEGLTVELRHHTPGDDAMTEDGNLDPRGAGCGASADAYVTLITPEEAQDVLVVMWDQRIVFRRIGNELVNVTHLNFLSSLYFNAEADGNTLLLIADLYKVLCDKHRRELAESDSIMSADGYDEQSLEEIVAGELHIPQTALRRALEYKEYCEAEDAMQGATVDEATGEIQALTAGRADIAEENDEEDEGGDDEFYDENAFA